MKFLKAVPVLFGLVFLPVAAGAQYRTDASAQAAAGASSDTLVLSLEQALKIALGENVAVKVADQEIERQEYARKGSYAALFPQVSGTGSYQRTIKKQVMYMGGGDDEDGGGMASMFTDIMNPIYTALGLLAANTGTDISGAFAPAPAASTSSSDGGFEVGRMNTYSVGVSAGMPLVNAQLWESIRLSGDQVELAVEQARSSRLDMVTQVKQAYYGVLFAKEAFNVYKTVYENAMENFAQTERKFKVQKASELELSRAASTVANAIPNVYNAESNVMLGLWQLKAVMGLSLDRPVDVSGKLSDYAGTMFRDLHQNDSVSLDGNSALRQLALQAEMLSRSIRVQQYAYLPTLSTSFSYSFISMNDDFKFSEYRWTPYSFVGLSLNIPIFSGGKNLSSVRQAKVQKAELELQRVNTERQLKIAIRQYLNTMETAMKSHDAAREAVELAQKAYDISAKSYQVGKSTLTDLNDAQLVLTQALLAQNQAVYNFIVAKSNLEQTLGADFLSSDGKVDLQGSYGK
ncbi:MAG: TolC family protein [Bacteroidales bacterium]|nr:TolC family protein [Bacteroidales bacterium]